MKFASFEVDSETGAEQRVGVFRDDSLIDITASYGAFLESENVSQPSIRARQLAPPDLIEVLRLGDEAIDAIQRGMNYVSRKSQEYGPERSRLRYPINGVRILSPLPRPNTIRDFITFERHIGHFRDTVPEEWYELPVYYKGNPNSIVHPEDTVVWPSYTRKFDYELEVSAVIGKQGRNIDSKDADEYIIGYMIFNDFSARDIQSKEREVGLGPGKGKDFANGFGPFLVTAEEFDPTDARMTAHVNGDLWSEGNIGEMYHSFPDLVEHASMDETIHPGDVLGSGTVPSGCCPEVGKWVQPGDTIELSVDGLGTLTHRVGMPPEDT